MNEGISVYFEPGGAASYQRYVNDAVAKDRLIPLRQLNRPPTKQEDVPLLYAEGSAVVTYLVKTYGAERMALLLSSMKSGKTIDGALIAAYGKNRDLVENEWRATVGAPLLEIIAEPTPLPATPVPAGRARLSDNTTYEFWYEPIVEPRWLLIGALVAGISGFFIIGIGAISWMVRR